MIQKGVQKAAIPIPDVELVASYEYRQQLNQMAADFREVITHPNYVLPFLQPGRLTKCLPLKNRPGLKIEDFPVHAQFIVDVLLYCARGSTLPEDRNTTTPTPGGVQPCPSGRNGEPLVTPVLLFTIDSVVACASSCLKTCARSTTVIRRGKACSRCRAASPTGSRSWTRSITRRTT
ncbi:hypothetical protein L227DRAFT_374700 [Lentinus tigrinus ALCF2SS1-6]|uniref:Exosome RNA helicase MTR4-like beta-barrel domain-containing protein n=1 Tax=Lentinus tigrinus ALCF2SS1-6 TaxID=1328759 RepID=A0A5C2RQT2_9APHY|nr:hypothetical protein L227DRAFT_374700 [Lentinus tigrinus ALCF2SS1-6]